jgi:hypothetical protein
MRAYAKSALDQAFKEHVSNLFAELCGNIAGIAVSAEESREIFWDKFRIADKEYCEILSVFEVADYESVAVGVGIKAETNRLVG